MSLWFFRVSGKGSPEPPPELVSSLKQGSFYKAAAWQATREGFNLFTLEGKGEDVKDARTKFQKKPYKEGSIGKHFPAGTFATKKFEASKEDLTPPPSPLPSRTLPIGSGSYRSFSHPPTMVEKTKI